MLVMRLFICSLILTADHAVAQDADTMCRRLVSGECDGGWRYTCEERSCATEARHLVCSCSCQITVSDYVPCPEAGSLPMTTGECDPDTVRFIVVSYISDQAFILDARGNVRELHLSTEDIVFTASDMSRGLVFFSTYRLQGVAVYDFASGLDHIIASDLGDQTNRYRGRTMAIGVDASRELVFVDSAENGIFSMTYEGDNIQLLAAVTSAIDGMAIDSDNRIIYFTNRDEQRVEMVDYTDLDAPGPRVVLFDGLPDFPTGIWHEQEAETIYFILTDGHIYEMPIVDPSATKAITGACRECGARSLVKCGDSFYYADLVGDSVWKIIPSEGNNRVKVNSVPMHGEPHGLSII